MKTIEDLRNDAKHYLCPSCFQQYERYFEPSIRHLLLNPIEDWSGVEFYVTQMVVMKKIGVFKGRNIDEINTYQKIEKSRFSLKINYLAKEGILQKASYELLDKANKVRNKIHSFIQPFSEQDLKLFYIAHVITSNIYSATIFEMGEDISTKDISTNLKCNAEKVAEQYLLNLKYK